MIRPAVSEWRGAAELGQPTRSQPGEQRAVQLFGKVVAELVGRVDAALYGG